MDIRDAITILEKNFNLPVHNPKGIRPELMTADEYETVANPRGKWHPDSAYDWSLADLNGKGWTDKDRFPRLLKQITVRGLKFEFRLQQNGRELSLGLFQGNTCVGITSDEWGALLIAVAKEYRGWGFGTILGKLARTMEPAKDSGGFTGAGRTNFRALHREMVRDALTSGFYNQLIKSREITPARVRAILQSVNLQKRAIKPSGPNLNSEPKDWLVYGEDGCFILYDRKLPELMDDDLWGEEMIKGYILVRIDDFFRNGEAGLVVQLGGDTPKITEFMMALGASFCQENNVQLAVDEIDLPTLTSNRWEIGAVNLDTGMKRAKVTLKETINTVEIGEADRVFRSKDRYGEFKDRLLEMAHGKFGNGH